MYNTPTAMNPLEHLDPVVLQLSDRPASGQIKELGFHFIPSTREMYAEFASWLTDRLEEKYGHPGFRMGYAVGETIENVVDHGTPGTYTQVRYYEQGDRVFFHITSTDGSFDPRKLKERKEPTLHDNRGRGLQIIMGFAETLAFDPDGKGLYMQFKKDET